MLFPSKLGRFNRLANIETSVSIFASIDTRQGGIFGRGARFRCHPLQLLLDPFLDRIGCDLQTNLAIQAMRSDLTVSCREDCRKSFIILGKFLRPAVVMNYTKSDRSLTCLAVEGCNWMLW